MERGRTIGRNIVVRPGEPADLPLLTELSLRFFDYLKATVADEFWEGAEVEPERARADFETAFAKDELVLIASLDGRSAGYLYGRIEPAYVRESPIRQMGYISHCFVREETRGAGVAAALAQAAEDWFRERGIEHIELRYSLANKAAAAVWAKLGYAPQRLICRKTLSRPENR
ncbi:GNAT family N-acetyltransferase [Hypericibacter sp.]|uniref:GNAT family N-acetyltransferase n=1 Tax=Hypericibacter sp. TaxID=2705401 RepID=UPI003D6C96EC